MMGFIDDISEAIADAGNDVMERAKELRQIANLKREYKETEKFVQGRYEGIGRDFYLKNKDKKKKDLGDITEALEKMDELQKEIEKLKGGINCPSCNALNNSEAIYCNKCGARLDEALDGEKSEEDYAEVVDAEVVDEETQNSEASSKEEK